MVAGSRCSASERPVVSACAMLCQAMGTATLASLRTGRPDFPTIQVLRALAALMVVAFHALEAWQRLLDPRHATAAWPNGSAGVDLFFVISGFVIAIASRSLAGGPLGWRLFLMRRLQRIVPLYWLLTTCMLAMVLLAPALAPHIQPGVWNTAASYLFVPSYDRAGLLRPVLTVGWTLNFEMLFYVLFAAALAWRIAPLKLLLPILLPLALLGFFRLDSWPAVTSLANSLVLEFCFGIVVAQIHMSGRRVSPAWAWCLLVGGCCLLPTLPDAGAARGLVWGLPAAAIVLGATMLEPVLGPYIPVLALELGDASYAIYLVHPFIVPALAHGFRHLPVSRGALLFIEVGASILASGLAGRLLNQRLERPMLAWFRRGRPQRSVEAAQPVPMGTA